MYPIFSQDLIYISVLTIWLTILWNFCWLGKRSLLCETTPWDSEVVKLLTCCTPETEGHRSEGDHIASLYRDYKQNMIIAKEDVHVDIREVSVVHILCSCSIPYGYIVEIHILEASQSHMPKPCSSNAL